VDLYHCILHIRRVASKDKIVIYGVLLLWIKQTATLVHTFHYPYSSPFITDASAVVASGII
jgi:hypothetical protein